MSLFIIRNNIATIMAEEKKSKLKRKLRIAIYEENTFEQIFSWGLTPINLFAGVGMLIVVFIVGVTLLIAFTSLREYIPGYPSGEERRAIVNNLQRTDSLIAELRLRDNLLSHMRAAISGELPIEAYDQDSIFNVHRKSSNTVSFVKSEADSIFRLQIEREEKFNLNSDYARSIPAQVNTPIELSFLFPPIKGLVTSDFGETRGHFGVDIVSNEGDRVVSVLDGTVIFAEWTVETGYVIQVQHDNHLISVYKHNSKLLKRVGMRVMAGEVIALVGNSGELTTGTHLHFEMWHSGVPLNPENYISFD